MLNITHYQRNANDISLSIISAMSYSLWKWKWSRSVVVLTLCNPMDCSLRGYSVHGIFQSRILEWVAFSFSRRSSRPRDQTRVSRIVGRRFTTWATREVKQCIFTVVWRYSVIWVLVSFLTEDICKNRGASQVAQWWRIHLQCLSCRVDRLVLDEEMVTWMRFPLDEEMITCPSVLAWRFPWTEGAWRAIVHGVSRVRHVLTTKQQ